MSYIIYLFFFKNHFSACPAAGRMNLFGRHGNGDCDTDQSDDVVNPANLIPTFLVVQRWVRV